MNYVPYGIRCYFCSRNLRRHMRRGAPHRSARIRFPAARPRLRRRPVKTHIHPISWQRYCTLQVGSVQHTRAAFSYLSLPSPCAPYRCVVLRCCMLLLRCLFRGYAGSLVPHPVTAGSGLLCPSGCPLARCVSITLLPGSTPLPLCTHHWVPTRLVPHPTWILPHTVPLWITHFKFSLVGTAHTHTHPHTYTPGLDLYIAPALYTPAPPVGLRWLRSPPHTG